MHVECLVKGNSTSVPELFGIIASLILLDGALKDLVLHVPSLPHVLIKNAQVTSVICAIVSGVTWSDCNVHHFIHRSKILRLFL